MFEKDAMDILMKFLDRKVLEAEQEVTTKGTLSEDKAIPLMLKMQFNHIRHLEESVNDRFGQINQRFEQVNRRFDKVDERFERITNDMNGRFKQITDDMNERFKQYSNEMNSRFQRADRHLMLGFAALGFLMAAFRFLH